MPEKGDTHNEPNLNTKTNFDNYPVLKAALHEAGMAPLLTLDETAGLLKTENISLNHFFQKNLSAKDE